MGTPIKKLLRLPFGWCVRTRRGRRSKRVALEGRERGCGDQRQGLEGEVGNGDEGLVLEFNQELVLECNQELGVAAVAACGPSELRLKEESVVAVISGEGS